MKNKISKITLLAFLAVFTIGYSQTNKGKNTSLAAKKSTMSPKTKTPQDDKKDVKKETQTDTTKKSGTRMAISNKGVPTKNNKPTNAAKTNTTTNDTKGDPKADPKNPK